MAEAPTSPFQHGVTVGAVIRAAFPEGIPEWRVFFDSNATSVEEKRPRPFEPEGAIQHSPNDPLDVFAVAALLLARSGAYHHVQPQSASAGLVPEFGEQRRLLVGWQERDQWCEAGARWAEVVREPSGSGSRTRVLVLPPPLVGHHWRLLVEAQSLPVFELLHPTDAPPTWWRSALALLIMADEACRDVGFVPAPPLSPTPQAPQLGFVTMVANRIRRAMLEQPDADGRGVYTISAADPDTACVLPKSRTPSLGCTLRSLSHNVALLPPRGLARARWLVQRPEEADPDSRSALNLLLVPYPYALAGSAFRGVAASSADSSRPWGWFSVTPTSSAREEIEERHPGLAGPEREGVPALPDESLIAFTKSLVEAASHDLGPIHGVVFPELALSWITYKNLVEEFAFHHPSVVFVIAGLRTNEAGEVGNFVATALLPDEPVTRANLKFVEDVRQKHHRWCLDAAQVANYGLGAALDPSKNWWERLNVLSRSLSVGVLRGETTIAALICEDLARVDPAQELLRAIGPNIVFALLMDGPQLQTRWPNRYATVLAEDPGSSVLTFTSLGLIERVNAIGQYSEKAYPRASGAINIL